MKKIIASRSSGKTTELIRISSITKNYIVCQSIHDATRIQLYAKELGYDIPLPLSYDEFINKKYNGNGITGFLIDNVDMLLKRMSGNVPINAITLNIEE